MKAAAPMANINQVVLFPYMAQGHFIPFLKLANVLAAQGLDVAFVTTTASISRIFLLQSQSQFHDLDIRFVSLSLPPIEGLPPGCESSDVLSPTEAELLFHGSHKLSTPFEQWMEQLISETSVKPLCIISDVFLPWTAESASKFEIPRVVFHTTGAFGASCLQYFFTDTAEEIIGEQEIIAIRDCSMSINLRQSDLPPVLRNKGRHSAFLGMVQAYGVAKESCAATLVNTFDAIEEGYVRYLEETTGKPVWAVARPTLLHDRQEPAHDCIQWLDHQKPQSVLYISFGSQVFLSEGQIKGLAKGIETSGQPFLWTIKDFEGSGVNSCEFLPKGFTEATQERGLVIHGWVPQKLILSHSSTACFLSHCGWNSTLESICAGVPMIVWPMIHDQPFNARLVVDHLGIGLQVCEEPDKIPRDEIVERTVNAVMEEEIGKEMRERARKLKESIDGVSYEVNVSAFLSYILNIN
uniref:Glycosyltransferase n=1 Tax=Araucaria cunninghamii TaxID=56994 RepID=A0A0D6QV12_ARACU